MPTYQYACTECGHAFEIVQSFADDSLTVCPKCDGRLRKVFNAVGVVFKGSGFYRNDSRGKQPESGSPATTASTPAASGSTSSDGGSSSSPAAASSGSSGSSESSKSPSTSPSSSGSAKSGSGSSGSSGSSSS